MNLENVRIFVVFSYIKRKNQLEETKNYDKHHSLLKRLKLVPKNNRKYMDKV